MAQSGHRNRPERKCMTLQRYPEKPSAVIWWNLKVLKSCVILHDHWHMYSSKAKQMETTFTKNRWRGCRLFLLTFIRVPSFTKTWWKICINFTSHDTKRAFNIISVVFKSSRAGDSQLNDCVNGNTGVVQGRQGGLAVSRQKQWCYQSPTLPGCSRSRWPWTLYSMLTRRNKFSWDTKQKINRDRERKQQKRYKSKLFSSALLFSSIRYLLTAD